MIAQLLRTYFSQNKVFKVQWCFSQIEQFSVFKGWIILSYILCLELVNIPSFMVYILYHINFIKYIIKHYQHPPFVFPFHLLWASQFISCRILWTFQKNLDASKNLCFYYFYFCLCAWVYIYVPWYLQRTEGHSISKSWNYIQSWAALCGC